MYLNWRQRLNQQPQLNKMDNWPVISVLFLKKPNRKKFIRNYKIIVSVLAGETLKETAVKYDVSSSTVNYLLNRCLAGIENVDPPLTAALVPGNRLVKGERKKKLSSLERSQGCRGSFQYLIRNVPNLRNHLDNLLSNHIKRTKYGQNLNPKFFHKAFLQYLIDKNWPKNKYPFDQTSLAYESARKYFHQRIKELSVPKQRKKQITITRKLPKYAYQDIQIDSQLLDINSSIYIELSSELIPLRMSRITLFLAKDVATDAIISYHLWLTKSPNQYDLLNLIEGIHRPWKPLKLSTPGLKYVPGSCLPTGLQDSFQRASIGILRLDNALCHLADTVKNYVCSKLNATLNYGLPGQPKKRNFVEYAFRLISSELNRFPSTTGSHPKDPIKETRENIKHPPILTINALEEALSILITAHNVHPQGRLGGSSPIDLLQHQMSKGLIRTSSAQPKTTTSPFNQRRKVNLHWYRHEGRTPHINFEGIRYSNKHNFEKYAAKASKIVIEFDPRDIRSVTAYSENGKRLGILHAEESWQKFPHSITTRKRIKQLIRSQKLKSVDPLASYFSYLLNEKHLPKNATEIVRLSRETHVVSSQKSENKFAQKTPAQRRYKGSNRRIRRKIPTWSSGLFKTQKKPGNKKWTKANE